MTQSVPITKTGRVGQANAQASAPPPAKPKPVAHTSNGKSDKISDSAKVQQPLSSTTVLKLEAGPKYYSLIEKTKMVAQRKSHAMMCLGDVGVGKSTIIKETLESENLDEGKHFIFMRGFTTPMALYERLYENCESGKIIIIDDCDAALKNKTCLDLMKAVLDDKYQRQVSYETRRQSSELPKSFVFAGSVIFISNYRAKENDIHFRAIQDRCLVQKMHLTTREKLEYIEKIIVPQDYKSTTQDERKKIFALMRDCVAQGGEKFSFRAYFQLLDFYKHDPKNFDIHLKQIIPHDNELTCLLEIRKVGTKKEWMQRFMEVTGKSRRSYFYAAQRLDEIFPESPSTKGGANE